VESPSEREAERPFGFREPERRFVPGEPRGSTEEREPESPEPPRREPSPAELAERGEGRQPAPLGATEPGSRDPGS